VAEVADDIEERAPASLEHFPPVVQSRMLGLVLKDDKVTVLVIAPDIVDVMHDGCCWQRVTERLLCDDAV